MNRLRTGAPENFRVTRSQVKLCALCGTLNHERNAECWTCRWHGEFDTEEQTIALAWQRLETLYEEVRFEHVTSRKMRQLGDFGAPQTASLWVNLQSRCRGWWERFQAGREQRMAQRASKLRSRTPTPPDQLGV